jgi:hypothetical protein
MASAVNETYLTASGVILQREVGLKGLHSLFNSAVYLRWT